jgi:cell division septation protein DedD
MWINTLAVIFLMWQPVADVPNYFPNFLQAREAAEKSQKTMVIFISSPDCERCDAAWNAFTKDPDAVNGNVSTRVDIENFDGRIIADLYEAGDAPAWIILNAEGEMTSKWNGGWKDAAGNPSMFIEPDMTAKPKVIETPKQTPSTISAQPVVNNSNKPSSPTPPVVKPENSTAQTTTAAKVKSTTPASTPASTTPIPVTTPSTATSAGFVLQAGYFGSEANAQKCIAEMKAKGCGDYIIKTQIKDGTTFYRVVSASYSTEGDANAAMNSAITKGAKVTVKKVSEI